MQGFLGSGQDGDLPSPSLFVGVQGRELGDIEEGVGADVLNLAQVDGDARAAGADGDPAEPVPAVGFGGAEELLDLLPAPEGTEGEGGGR
ncbi:hypothetical protein ABZZ47_43700 [Streptomyces sp. NPDC006465]|uniref:hypothetical protein n=1 Tax=Streptomyces sp. NPDC006465 TaxID=3157174 RepID=UPI0033AC7C05